MGPLEWLSLAAVCLIALYGAACLVTWLVWRLVRPKHPRLSLRLELLPDMEDTELQVRFALEVSRRTGLPLAVYDRGANEEARAIATALCGACLRVQERTRNTE